MLISVFVGTSLDGFIARKDGSFDFLPTDGGEPHGFTEFWKSIDALVIGRKTYETVLGFGGWAYDKKPVFVLSSQPMAPAPAEAVVEHLLGPPAEIVKRLSSRGIRNVYLDGGDTIQRFLRVGLVDRLIITRVPVLIGEGISLFGTVPHDIPVRHIATRSFRTGLVQSEYHLDRSSRKEQIVPLWGAASARPAKKSVRPRKSSK
jgi:dihydrofolate reductase